MRLFLSRRRRPKSKYTFLYIFYSAEISRLFTKRLTTTSAVVNWYVIAHFRELQRETRPKEMKWG